MSTISAVLVGLEVMILVIRGIAGIVGFFAAGGAAAAAGTFVSVCSALGPSQYIPFFFTIESLLAQDTALTTMLDTVLAAAGILFAIVFIVVAFAFAEDPLDDLVVKFGKKYGIVQ